MHAIPIACAGEVDSHLEQLYVKDRGIKGAFWANYLSAVHVGMAGGEQQIRAQLPGLRIEGLNHGGLLVVATDSPLPDDTEDNRRRFLRIHAALQPAFLSREETSENWRRDARLLLPRACVRDSVTWPSSITMYRTEAVPA